MSKDVDVDEFINSAYLAILNRRADVPGIEYWTEFIQQKGRDLFISRLFASKEYEQVTQAKQLRNETLQALAAKSAEIINNDLNIIDVGSVDLDGEEHVWSKLADYLPIRVTGFDPMDKAKTNVRYPTFGKFGLTRTTLPMALGDGASHVLHINNYEPTSSFFELDVPGPLAQLHTLYETSSITLPTRKLDEVAPLGFVDFLKLDIQGAELMTLQHGTQLLKRVGTIYLEGSFNQHYKNQPLMPELDQFLRAHGFSLVDIYPIYYAYEGVGEIQSQDVLMWGDLHYIKESQINTVLASQALISAVLFNKPNLSAYLLSKME